MGILEVSNVKKIYTTRFGGNQVQALSNISFSVKPGQTVGIIGGTGSGKSTLVSLITRFYDASEGKVLVDGVDGEAHLLRLKDPGVHLL